MPAPADSSSLTGRLLLAVPSMRDPNFARAVIFMAAHTEMEGAFGYVLNRPLEQRVADLLPIHALRYPRTVAALDGVAREIRRIIGP